MNKQYWVLIPRRDRYCPGFVGTRDEAEVKARELANRHKCWIDVKDTRLEGPILFSVKAG